MDVVFRIFDNCLASGIEALFSFSLVLLLKNEQTLLSLKFDQLVSFLNVRIFDLYQVTTCVLARTSSNFDLGPFRWTRHQATRLLKRKRVRRE